MAFSRSGGDDGDGKGKVRVRVYHCPRCHARNQAYGDIPPICAACALPLGPEDEAPPPDTRGRTSWVISLGVVLLLGFIAWQQRNQLGDPGLGLGAVFGLGHMGAEDAARERSEAIRLCTAEARSRLGQAYDDAPFGDQDVRLDAGGGYRLQSRMAGSDSLPELTHAGFTCRVQRVDASYGGWEITEFTVQGDDAVPAPSSASPSVPGPGPRTRTGPNYRRRVS